MAIMVAVIKLKSGQSYTHSGECQYERGPWGKIDYVWVGGFGHKPSPKFEPTAIESCQDL